MAQDIGVSVGTVEGWIKGWRRPTLAHVPKLAVYLDLTDGEIVAAALEEPENWGGDDEAPIIHVLPPVEWARRPIDISGEDESLEAA